MTCPRCQQDNPLPDAQFCPRCGAPVKHADGSGPPAPSYAEVTSALSESLEQQTATSEILRVISSSPTDVRPVFDAIVASATRWSERDPVLRQMAPLRGSRASCCPAGLS